MDYLITASGLLGLALAGVGVVGSMFLFVRGCNTLGDVLLKVAGRG